MLWSMVCCGISQYHTPKCRAPTAACNTGVGYTRLCCTGRKHTIIIIMLSLSHGVHCSDSVYYSVYKLIIYIKAIFVFRINILISSNSLSVVIVTYLTAVYEKTSSSQLAHNISSMLTPGHVCYSCPMGSMHDLHWVCVQIINT